MSPLSHEGEYMTVKYFNPQQASWYNNRLKELNGRLNVMQKGGINLDRQAQPLGFAGVSQDTTDLQKEIRRIESEIKEHTAPKRKPAVKNKLYSQAKKLLSDIMEGMPSKSEMWGICSEGGKSRKMDTFEFSETVRKHGDWEIRNSDKIRKFRNIMYQLDISNPLVGNTDFIRRCGSVDEFFQKVGG